MPDLRLHPDRLFPADPAARAVARELYEAVADLPIVSPHGHCDPAWFAENAPFPNPAELLIKPGPLCLPDAAQRRRSPGGSGPSRLGRDAQRGRPGRRLAPVRRALSPVSRHALAAVARLGVRRGFRSGPAADRRDRRRLLRRHRGAPWPRPDFRPRARCSSGSTSRCWRRRKTRWTRSSTTRRSAGPAGADASSPPSAPTMCSIRTSPDFEPIWRGWARSLARTRSATRAICARWRTAGPSFARPGRPRRTMAIRPRRPSISIPMRRNRCSPRSSRARVSPAEAERLPRPYADADGADEPGRRHGDADPSRRDPAITTPPPFAGSDGTRGADIPDVDGNMCRRLKPLLNRYGADSRLSLIVFTLDETSYSARTRAPGRLLSGDEAWAALVVS